MGLCVRERLARAARRCGRRRRTVFFSRRPVHTVRGGNAVAAAAAGCPWSCVASHIPALAHRRRVPAGHVL